MLNTIEATPQACQHDGRPWKPGAAIFYHFHTVEK